MFEDDPTEVAARGETGIDLFTRITDPNQKRARFRCIATLRADGTFEPLDAAAKRKERALTALAQQMDASVFAKPLSFTDPQGWPRAATGGDPLRLFLYLEFFRAWQVADLAATRFEARLARDPASLPPEPGTLASAIAPVLDFNRVTLGLSLARLSQPVLAKRVTAPGFRDDSHGGTGYALRMLGDLCLRGGDAALALSCFETAVDAGDNPFRRRKAIEAARLVGDREAISRHRTGYKLRWQLPADLTEAGDPS
ncbi:hypothetical protein JI664_17780 [Rhodobacter sp. NTK016B]|uniref:hypothetical protein n=1 Tax=Rhodobacter sp. NTK016B TaxID=2759676 RepID=UPI001A8E585E|nr:hypothetical protein [Rhodobacter sp. NTK016B]MBN8293826.1 hypothetical protein [Rhodobacter sp. NTK016B]